ncbi:MAG: autotransporter-associated beta strand repeat-containing protein [Verrucomicrobia bacterium]|nr:autotransporter-associated beta strand repeat-containing protein [Verrucomicrobiota bacterium]
MNAVLSVNNTPKSLNLTIMNNFKNTGHVWLATALLALGMTAAQAQVNASWSGNVDTDWNNAGNWDVGVPAEGTNAIIGGSATVNYNTPMVATSFATLSLGSSVLTINTNGFNIDPGVTTTVPFTISSGGALNVNTNGIFRVADAGGTTFAVGSTVTNNGTMIFSNTGTLTLPNGASPVNILTANPGSVFLMTNSISSGAVNLGASSSSQGAIMTINGGTVTFDKLLSLAGVGSRVFVRGGVLNCLGGSRLFDQSNDGADRIDVSGGVANVGNLIVSRTSSAGGLVVANGQVNATGIQIGTGNSMAYATINSGGIVTNTGVFTVSDNTNAATSGDRRAQFLIRGGTVVSTAAAGIILANQANGSPNVTVANANIGGILDINAGSLTAEKITLIKDSNMTNAYARLNLSGTGIVYLGSGGLAANVGPSKTAFNIAISGGTLAAKADWASTATAVMPLSGTTTFQAADAAGGAHSITLSNVLSGSGAIIVKTGAGTLNLLATNTYTGNTFINAGTLAMGPVGYITNSAQIILTNGGVYDVSAVAAGANLGSSQILSGQGSVAGNLTAPNGSAIRPGGNGSVGTLTFLNALAESGGVVNNFDLSTNTSAASNDFITITGDLNLSGTNTILVNPLFGPLPANSVYKLIQYGGNFATGGITNLALSGAAGVLTNDTTAKTISLMISSGIRSATNVIWRGDGVANNWDLLISSNWLNGSSRDYFAAGDSARFDDSGASNLTVNVVGSVAPGAITVDSQSNYVFSGSGTIDGSAGLVKTNSGTLTISTLNNNYAGGTVIGGGILEVAKLAAGGTACSLGIASSDPANLQLFGTTLRYLGGNVSIDRGATLNPGIATIDVATDTKTLTTSGNLIGPGGLTKVGLGTLTLSGANTYSDVTTISNGTLQINGSTTAALGTNVVNLDGGTIFLNVSGQPTYANAFNINAASGMNVGGNNTLFTGVWSGSGTLNANVNAGGFFTINSAISPNFTGTLAMGTSGGLLRFNGGGGSPCLGSDYCTFDLGTSTNALVNRNGGGLVYSLGGLAGGSGTQLRGSENTGSGSIYQIGSNNLNTTFGGTIKTGNGGTGATVAIVKIGSGTLTLTGTNTYTGSTTINAGGVALSGSGSIGNTSTILLFTNTVLDSSGRTDGTLTLNSGQTLQGGGTVRGSVVVRSNAVLSVGDDSNLPEPLVITNTLTLQANSTLNMDVDHYQFQAALTNDVIKGLASVTYGGTLNLSVISIETNSVFKLFSAGSYHGGFATITPTLPPLNPAVWQWDTSQLTVDGTLRIKALPPSFGNVNFSGLSGGTIILNAVNGYPGATVQVLTSSDITLPMALWTTNATTTFDGGGNLNTFSITVNPHLQQLYIRLQE